MNRKNFAATAVYFQRRAEKASSVRLRQQFEAAAAHYRAMAQACGHHSEPDSRHRLRAPDIPPRRQRLIELFHACSNVAPRLPIERIAQSQKRDEQGGTDEGSPVLDAASSKPSS